MSDPASSNTNPARESPTTTTPHRETEDPASTSTKVNESTSSPSSHPTTPNTNTNKSTNLKSPAGAGVGKSTKPVEKVVVKFRAAGNAPIMKQTRFKITAAEKFQTVIDFLRKQLKFKQTDSIFVYINQAFSPSPDEVVRNLYRCFEVDGKLDIHYSTTPAWG
eukprot:Nk52_evm19s1524 gene=Nk52_evmTU19s1524